MFGCSIVTFGRDILSESAPSPEMIGCALCKDMTAWLSDPCPTCCATPGSFNHICDLICGARWLMKIRTWLKYFWKFIRHLKNMWNLCKFGWSAGIASALLWCNKGLIAFHLIVNSSLDYSPWQWPMRVYIVPLCRWSLACLVLPQTESNLYADCFIDPAELPVELISGAEVVVTGTLGLACDPTATTMHRVLDLAKSSQTTVRHPCAWDKLWTWYSGIERRIILSVLNKKCRCEISDDSSITSATQAAADSHPTSTNHRRII